MNTLENFVLRGFRFNYLTWEGILTYKHTKYHPSNTKTQIPKMVMGDSTQMIYSKKI